MKNKVKAIAAACIIACTQASYAEEVLRIDGEAIGTEVLDAQHASDIYAIQRLLYEARLAQAKKHLGTALLEREAHQRGMSPDQLYEAEVLEKVPSASLADVKAMLGQYGVDADTSNRTFMAVARLRMEERREKERKSDYLEGLRAKYKARIVMRPPALPELAKAVLDALETRHTRGSKDAPVELKVFSDYACEYCKVLEAKLDKLVQAYPDRLRIAYYHNPLDSEEDAPEMQAALLAECAQDKGRFWDVHRDLYKHWNGSAGALLDIASRHGIDETQFEACQASERLKDRVMVHVAAQEALDLDGAPVSYLNGMRIDGAETLMLFKSYIESELEDADKETDHE